MLKQIGVTNFLRLKKSTGIKSFIVMNIHSYLRRDRKKHPKGTFTNKGKNGKKAKLENALSQKFGDIQKSAGITSNISRNLAFTSTVIFLLQIFHLPLFPPPSADLGEREELVSQRNRPTDFSPFFLLIRHRNRTDGQRNLCFLWVTPKRSDAENGVAFSMRALPPLM